MNTVLDDLLGEDEEYEFRPSPSLSHLHNLEVLPTSREIHLCDEITEDTGAWFFRCTRWLESKSLEPIRLVLATPGGDIGSMFVVHDVIRNTPCPVEIVAVGDVCSAGVLILACGDRRLVTENVSLMSHESQGAEGDLGFKASKDRFEFRKWQFNRWCELMARYTPQEKTWWKNKTERQAEYWLLGGQAIVDGGLADEVVSTRNSSAPTGFDKRVIPFYSPILNFDGGGK
jgi:ATP-dependent protease ClpP protease subunit